MTWEKFNNLSETLAALEHRIAALEKENAAPKTERQESAPQPITSQQACKDIRNILQRLRSQQENRNDIKECDITDFIFLRSNGVIQCISAHED